jgi:hypothetical protein
MDVTGQERTFSNGWFGDGLIVSLAVSSSAVLLMRLFPNCGADQEANATVEE